jgi:hypothetical protein
MLLRQQCASDFLSKRTYKRATHAVSSFKELNRQQCPFYINISSLKPAFTRQHESAGGFKQQQIQAKQQN